MNCYLTKQINVLNGLYKLFLDKNIQQFSQITPTEYLEFILVLAKIFECDLLLSLTRYTIRHSFEDERIMTCDFLNAFFSAEV